jgi:hypothetical protein
MINLETKEKTIKAKFLDGCDISFIKVNERNKCVIVASEGSEKNFLVDYQGNKLTRKLLHPFSLTFSNEKEFKILN